VLGFGLLAVAVLLLGAWIETAASMYSASLSFANQMPRVTFQTIVGVIWLAGILLVVLGADTIFIPFLMTLGLALPPLAAILTLSHFLSGKTADARGSALAAASWIAGTFTGLATTNGMLTPSGLPVLDSILVTGAAYGAGCLLLARTGAARTVDQPL
jgi:purine-cytosine permease-like protein